MFYDLGYYLQKVYFYIFHVNFNLFVTAKSDQDPNPHWFGSIKITSWIRIPTETIADHDAGFDIVAVFFYFL